MSSGLVLASVAVATMLYATGAALSQSTLDLAALPHSSRPLVSVATLRTNNDNGARLATMVDEDEGRDQLSRLVASATTEEQWAYLPDRQIWVEIGIRERGAEVETDAGYLEQLLASFPSVHLYHFHPAAYFEAGLNGTLALALPSPTDVESSIRIAMLQMRFDPTVDIRNFVVSPHGVVEYGPTRLGGSRLSVEATHPRATIARDLLTLVAVRRSVFNVDRMLLDAPESTAQQVIAALCAQLSSEFYLMQFSPAPGQARHHAGVFVGPWQPSLADGLAP